MAILETLLTQSAGEAVVATAAVAFLLVARLRRGRGHRSTS